MTDIVERLRALAMRIEDEGELYLAADEIERLRAQAEYECWRLGSEEGMSDTVERSICGKKFCARTSKHGLCEVCAHKEIERLRGSNLKLRQAIAYMDDHAHSPTIIKREASRALEDKE